MQFVRISSMSMWRLVSGGSGDCGGMDGLKYRSLISDNSVRMI